MSIRELRESLPLDLPFALRELLIGNVIVGNFSAQHALTIANAIATKLRSIS